MTPLFSVQRRTVRGVPVLAIRGELDLASAPELAAAVDAERPTPGRGLVIDLVGCSFLDSSGARAVVAVGDAAARAGAAVALACPPGSMPRLVLDLFGLHHRFPVEDDCDAAVAAVMAPGSSPAASA